MTFNIYKLFNQEFGTEKIETMHVQFLLSSKTMWLSEDIQPVIF